MSTYAKKPFETRPDSGNLFAEPVKKTTLSPDYSGTIALNLKDLINSMGNPVWRVITIKFSWPPG